MNTKRSACPLGIDSSDQRRCHLTSSYTDSASGLANHLVATRRNSFGGTSAIHAALCNRLWSVSFDGNVDGHTSGSDTRQCYHACNTVYELESNALYRRLLELCIKLWQLLGPATRVAQPPTSAYPTTPYNPYYGSGVSGGSTGRFHRQRLNGFLHRAPPTTYNAAPMEILFPMAQQPRPAFRHPACRHQV